MLDTAVEAARKAGEVLSRYFEMTALERTVKDDKSFVTKADRESEEIIVSMIKEAYPEHCIIGEEGTDRNRGAEYQWFIDPLDGTNNFVNGIPIFAISIALVKSGEPVASVIYNPVTHSMYAAEKGSGMTYNGKPTRVSDQGADLGLVGFGPGGKEGKRLLDQAFVASSKHFKSKRYLGSTALELGYLARGGTEGFFCFGLKKWDYAAGTLLIREAGGVITDMRGGPWNLDTQYFIASNGVVHEKLVDIAKTFDVSSLKDV